MTYLKKVYLDLTPHQCRFPTRWELEGYKLDTGTIWQCRWCGVQWILTRSVERVQSLDYFMDGEVKYTWDVLSELASEDLPKEAAMPPAPVYLLDPS